MRSNFYATKITILFLWCFAALSGCREQGFEGDESSELSLVPSFAQSAAGKATDTGFQTGDRVGLYAGFENRQLDPDGNLIDNALMEAVDQSGVLTLSGNPALYYPSANEAVRLYAYYPHQAGVSSARALAAAVKSDQTAYADYTASDWCWGSLTTTPMATATPIVFHHRTAQVNLNATLPVGGKIGNKTIAKITTSGLHGVFDGGAFDLSSGTWSNLDSQGDLSPWRPDAAANRFLTVLPPQTIEAGKVFASITVEYSDATNETFDFTPENPITLTAGTSTTVAIALDDKGNLSLTTVQVEDWVDTSAAGAIVDPVNNPFTLHWRLPHHYFARVSRVELVLDLPDGTKLAVEAQNVKVEADGSKLASSYTFDVAMDPSTGVAYPYQIGAVRFYDGSDLLQECASIKGATVYRSGQYTIGIEQDRLLAVRSGVITDWNELLYGDRLRGVDNDFAIQMIEYPTYESVKGIKLVIDGQSYTFNSVSAISGSHAMLSQTSVFRFPDASGKAPYKYPFVVEQVTLLDGSGGALGDGRYGCAIRVSRAGAITMQLYRGVLSQLATTVVGYNSSSAVGRPEYGGAVTSNPVRVVYCDGRQQAACDGLARVDLTIGGRDVALTDYKMDGTRFAAQSRAPHIDIVSGGADRPLTYPYEVTAVKFRKADGTLLAAAPLAEPLVVDWWGELSFELMVEMADVPHVAHRPTPAEYVEVGGLRWAKGNLVAVDNRNCRVGAPTDGGVYFQFGSLIGWKGGALANGGNGVGIPDGAMQTNGKFWNGAATWSWANDAMVSSEELVTVPTAWPQGQTTNQWYFGLQAGWSTAEQNIRDYPGLVSGALADKGVGDPCTYYLGDPWRQPTTVEYKTLCNNQGGYGIQSTWSNCNASWSDSPIAGGSFAGTQLFFPASGCRHGTNGSIYSVLAAGYGWSSSIYLPTDGLRLHFHADEVYSQNTTNRVYAFPVRCVSEAPREVNTPTVNDYVEIDMGSGKKLKWTKGNLIATSGRGCKVGKPEDGGLYFQFGSLIGYKGGSWFHNGTGVGMPQAPLTTNGTFWNGTGFSWASDAMVWPSEMTKTPTAWPNNETTNQWYFGLQTDWSTAGQDIRDYPGLAVGSLANAGVGDACSYYLGGTWRLPTTAEQASITGKMGGAKILWETDGLTGRWAIASETFGGVFGPGAWFGIGLNAGSGTPTAANLFVPASGLLGYSSGAFYNVTAEGHGWSSSVSTAANGHSPSVHKSNGMIPQNSVNRSNGFPVRCVSN